MKGYIKLFRDITEHWIWQEKPFSPGQAWVDLLMMVNHASKKFPLGKELVWVERGSCITSELKLMERWGWSKTKVRTFLALLEKDEMIAKNTDRKKTTLTICNYNDWQDPETTEGLQKDHEKTTEEPYKNTNKNIILSSINYKGNPLGKPVDNVDNSGESTESKPKALWLLINGVLTDVTGLTQEQIRQKTEASIRNSLLGGTNE